MKAKNFKIQLDLYQHSIYMSFKDTDKNFKKWLGSAFSDIEDEVFEFDDRQFKEARTIATSGNNILVRFNFIPTDNLEVGLLIHELFHATTFILDRVGVKLDLMTSDEAYAYLIQHLTEKTLDRLKK